MSTARYTQAILTGCGDSGTKALVGS